MKSGLPIEYFITWLLEPCYWIKGACWHEGGVM